jgi:hypothetical protein
MFRLGSTKKGYVREFNVSDSSKYTTKKANMLMVTEDLANTY